MNLRATTVIAGWRLPLDEVSALCMRRGSDGAQELLAVGDEDFAIQRAVLHGDRLERSERLSVRDSLPGKLSAGGGGSEWEGVAADGSGRAFVLRESTCTVLVFSAGLRELEHVIRVDLEGSEDARARNLLDDPNAGPEGILLMKRGHLLVAKQRDPIVLIEFGPKGGSARGVSENSFLSPDEPFRLSDGRRTTLRPVASWRLDGDTESMVQSANDLAVDDRGRLHAISSRSRCIFQLDASTANDEKISITDAWAIEQGADRDRKLEGLTFDDQGRPIVALDLKGSANNAFLLERLER